MTRLTCVLLLLCACTPKVGKVTITPSRVGLTLASPLTTLAVTVLDENGDRLPDYPVTWSSDAPDIVSVEKGLLRAHDGGVAIITATAGGVSGTCEATVRISPCKPLPPPQAPGPASPPPSFELLTVPVTKPWETFVPFALDLTEDGFDDLIFFSRPWEGPERGVVVWASEPDGGFSDMTTPWLPRPIDAAVVRGSMADLRGDGTTALLLAAQCSVGDACSNLGGSARSRIVFITDAGLVEDPRGFVTPDGGLGVTVSLEAGDVDCDGRQDVYQATTVYYDPPELERSHLWMNRADGGLTIEDKRIPAAVTEGFQRFTVGRFCDFNADGAADLVLGGEGRPSRVFLNDGFGSLRNEGWPLPASPSLIAEEQFVKDIDCVDFDRDGRDDLLLSLTDRSWSPTAPGYLQVLRNVDGKTFTTVNVPPLETPPATSFVYETIQVSDFNRDGWPDFVVSGSYRGAGYPHVYTNMGDGTFSHQVLSDLSLTTMDCVTYTDRSSGRPSLLCPNQVDGALYRPR